jgi:hypothetical protein
MSAPIVDIGILGISAISNKFRNVKMSRHECIMMFELIMMALFSLMFHESAQKRADIFNNYTEFMDNLRFQQKKGRDFPD